MVRNGRIIPLILKKVSSSWKISKTHTLMEGNVSSKRATPQVPQVEKADSREKILAINAPSPCDLTRDLQREVSKVDMSATTIAPLRGMMNEEGDRTCPKRLTTQCSR
jgi:hypothetical protein